MPTLNAKKAAIAARLVQARHAKNFATSRAIAIKLGVSPKTYADHERGEADVRPAELRRYAETLDVSHCWLSTGIGEGPRKA